MAPEVVLAMDEGLYDGKVCQILNEIKPLHAN